MVAYELDEQAHVVRVFHADDTAEVIVTAKGVRALADVEPDALIAMRLRLLAQLKVVRALRSLKERGISF